MTARGTHDTLAERSVAATWDGLRLPGPALVRRAIETGQITRATIEASPDGIEQSFRASGAALALGVFPLPGPRFDHAQAGVAPRCAPTDDPGLVGCVPNANVVANERAYGPFLLWIPQLAASTSF